MPTRFALLNQLYTYADPTPDPWQVVRGIEHRNTWPPEPPLQDVICEDFEHEALQLLESSERLGQPRAARVPGLGLAVTEQSSVLDPLKVNGPPVPRTQKWKGNLSRN